MCAEAAGLHVSRSKVETSDASPTKTDLVALSFVSCAGNNAAVVFVNAITQAAKQVHLVVYTVVITLNRCDLTYTEHVQSIKEETDP